VSSYRGEWLLLALVAAAALAVVNVPNTADVSRLGLTLAILHERSVATDSYAANTLDRARHGGHTYTDKAPGVSFVALVPVAALWAVDAARGAGGDPPLWRREGHLWLVRLLTGGVFLLASTFLLGRAAEARAPGTGAAVAATFGLGTLAAPLGPTTFGHLGAAALGFGAFLLALDRRPAAAGLAAGAALVVEYQAALTAIVVGVVSIVLRRRDARRYGLGLVPGVALLAAYDTAAFGRPWRLSYRYVANRFAERQHRGFFGIGLPDPDGLRQALVGSKGLLLVSPVLAAAAVGLALAWRRGRRLEAGACGAVTLLFLLYDAGYFDPYGGTSPGPRFFAPALPFLCLGLAEAYRRAPVVTGVLALVSIAVTTRDSLAWAISNTLSIETTPHTVWSLLGLPVRVGMWLVVATVAAAVVAAVAVSPGRSRSASSRASRTGAA
jgi:hypothetical protein